jgi:NAD(P)-dependent dehydrogenase (short-subunit alcohol dehydrogenase family)
LSAARLVVVTRNATTGGDLAGAAVWSLLRSAQTEHPDRFVLVDLDGSEASHRSLPAVAAVDEPQLAVRGGEPLVPRLVRVPAAPLPVGPVDPDGTVLITGGTGALGIAVARHLVTEHGARRLLLVSRRGRLAADVATELSMLGARVDVVACDTADRDAVARLLSTIPAAHPLTAVVHAAGVLDDGTIETLTGERLATAFRPKVDAAWHLHELTASSRLTSFVVFSSLAGTLGTPGQANYAAANGFLDALAIHRRAAGLPAVSVAWGAWEGAGLAADADRDRLVRAGVGTLPTKDGLVLFDRARESGLAVVVAARLDVRRMRQDAVRAEQVPPMFLGLVRRPKRRASGASRQTEALCRRLAELSAAERERDVLNLVCAHVAAVLGHGAPSSVVTDRGFLDMGLDSLMAIELRNRLDAVTGLRLPSTLVFDYPTPIAVAGFLLGRLLPEESPERRRAADDDAVRRVLASIPVERLRAAGLLDMLLGLAGEPSTAEGTARDGEAEIRDMGVADLVRRALDRS